MAINNDVIDLTGAGDNYLSNAYLEGQSTLKLIMENGTEFTVDLQNVGALVEKHLASAVLGGPKGEELILTMNDLTTMNVDFSGLVGDTFVSSGVISGDELKLMMNDGSNVSIDISTIAGDKFLIGGAMAGAELVLNMNNGDTVKVDLTNMPKEQEIGGKEWLADTQYQFGDVVTENIAGLPIAYSAILSSIDKKPSANANLWNPVADGHGISEVNYLDVRATVDQTTFPFPHDKTKTDVYLDGVLANPWTYTLNDVTVVFKTPLHHNTWVLARTYE